MVRIRRRPDKSPLANTHLDVFQVPTSKYIKHELTVWLPYFIKRHVLRKNIPKPPPLIGKADEPVKR